MNAVDWKCMCGATSNIYKHTITMAYLSTLDFQISCYRNVMTNTMYTLETSFNDLDTYDEKKQRFSESFECVGWVSGYTKLFIRSTMFNQSLWLDYWTFPFLFSHKIVLLCNWSTHTNTNEHWHRTINTFISFFVSAQIEFAVARARMAWW